MVLVKRILDNGINGYRSPIVPKAPRSVRKRGLREKRLEGGEICAFELLATVAGKLLEESECSSASSSAVVGFNQCGIGREGIKKEMQDVDKEHDDQGSSEGSVHFSGLFQKDVCKGKFEKANELVGVHVSPLVSSVWSYKLDDPESKLASKKSEDVFVKPSGNIKLDFPAGVGSDDIKVKNGLNRKPDMNAGASADSTVANKSVAPTSSKGIKDSVPKQSFLELGNGVNIGCKDDDEIRPQGFQPNVRKIFRSPTCVGDRRFRKLLTSKNWKSAPKLRDCEHTNSGGAGKQINHKRPCYEIDRSQRNTPFKKRRLFGRSSIVTYDGGISCESVSNSPEKSMDDKKNASASKLHEGNMMLPSGFKRQHSCSSRNSNVRLSIKSFKIPELFIEVPESTTVGSLKRTVLEAVTSILGGGLHVGVLLQGNKIRDDNRTLLQTGISQNDDMDTIGFMLEPNSPTQPPSPLCFDEPPPLLSCDSPKFVNRSQVNRKEDMLLLDSLEKPSMTDSNSPAASIRDLIPSAAVAELTDKNDSDCKALVPVPDASVEPLAIVCGSQRPKQSRSEIGQRRTRRPFSVAEVEALVHAVEKLGTGRWRDVKLCAFENAKHRTYVDLKDKWKTLVHTARISPQQRRGEPVPQVLLDRVLAAQAYWSEHQARQHGKSPYCIIPKLTGPVA